MYSINPTLAFLSLILTISSIVSAQAPKDPLKNFCRRYGHQTAVVDRKLYIDGGWLYANPIKQNPQPVINAGLLYDDLDSVTGGMPTQHANLTKNSTVPGVAGGILWTDDVNKVFYLYGGEFSSVPQAFQLWAYDIILDQWNLSDTQDTQVNRVAYGAGVSVTESAQAFYFGGYLSNKTDPLWSGPKLATSNLITYDMVQNTFANFTGPDSTGRAEGTMVYIPASGSGILVYFGGAEFPYGNETAVGASLDSILVYDIADAKWYTQTATGDIPASRRQSCGGATWAKDQSSYNVYIYGGFGFGENATGFDDVYILTMPAFEWIKWYPDEPGPGYPHGALSCNVLDNAQMIVMGGNFTNEDDFCDVPTAQGQHNLNLGKNNPTNAKWAEYQPDLSEYKVPSELLKVVGGSSSGGATVKSPSNGWDDNALPVYFNQKASYTVRAPTRAIPSPTGDPAPPPPNSTKKKNVGAIAGATVGAVVGLAALIILALILYRRRRNRKNHANAHGPSGPMSINTSVSRGAPSPDIDPKYPVYSASQPNSPMGSPPMHSHSPIQPHGSPYGTTPPNFAAYHQSHPSSTTSFRPHYSPPVPNADVGVPYHQPNEFPYYPPPESTSPGAERLNSHEMPTVRSPDAGNIVQPMPLRPDFGEERR
ncbi:MAG: hypothetical protein M1833_002004 [Piccolia ochrophora]|nr:MAG: hypothetical protein M1833_002004 [Piccolia ochrophora]